MLLLNISISRWRSDTLALVQSPIWQQRAQIQPARIYLLYLDFTRPALAALRDRQKDLKWVL